MAQLVRANPCATELLQRAVLISLPDGGAGRRHHRPHAVRLPIMHAKLLEQTARQTFSYTYRNKNTKRETEKTHCIFWFPLIVCHTLGILATRQTASFFRNIYLQTV